MAVALKESGKGLFWYQNDLLKKAVDIGDRLLAAFNTTTGIPYPKVRINLEWSNQLLILSSIVST